MKHHLGFLFLAAMTFVLVSACGAPPASIDELADAIATDLCNRCVPEEASDCISETKSDIVRNFAERASAYDADKGQACLDKIEAVECDAMPLNCEGNLAIAECNDYLDGQTNGVDPDCSADGTRRDDEN